MHILSKLIFELCQFFFDGHFADILIFSQPVDDIGERVFFVMKVFSEITDSVFKLLDSFVIEATVLDSDLCFEEPQSVDVTILLVILLEPFVEVGVLLLQG